MRKLLVPLAGVLLALAVQAPAQAADIPVADATSFAQALASAKPGDVIRLASTSFPRLTVGRQFTSTVTIAGSGSTTVDGLTVAGAANVTFEDMQISPAGSVSALSTVIGSSGIRFKDVHFVGAQPGGNVGLDIGKDSSDVQVVGGEFTLCKSACLKPGGRNIVVTGTQFHDCYDCDMVRGGGSAVTLNRDTFDRALVGAGGNHNDLIQIMGGGPWTIVNDRFGAHEHGAAQIYVNPGPGRATNPLHDVAIENSVFAGESGIAIRIGIGSSATYAPTGVKIVNNTILSGRISSIFLTDGWADVAEAARPIVANNIVSLAAGAGCGRGTWIANVVLTGTACATDRLARLTIGADGVPPSSAASILSTGDPLYAPLTDIFGHKRNGRPDIGAIQYSTAAPLALVAPRLLGRMLGQLRQSQWHLSVPLTLTSASGLSVDAKAGGRIVARLTRTAKSTSSRYVLQFVLPQTVRRSGTLVLTIRATGGGKAVTRTVVVRIF